MWLNLHHIKGCNAFMLIRRAVSSFIEAALADRPTVYIQGPRQAGKSTLLQVLCGHSPRQTRRDF